MFTHMIFYVKDVPAAADFYRRAFGFETKFLHESNTYAELDTGGTALAFASEELGDMNLPRGYQKNSLKNLPQACEIALTTEDPNALYKKALKEGAEDVAPPKEKPWGQVVAYVRDPSGILIEIAGKMN